MTREGDEKVSLTLSNWVGILVMILGGIGGQWLLLQGRVTTLEANQANMQREIDSQEQRSASTRTEILTEIRSLRAELKIK